MINNERHLKIIILCFEDGYIWRKLVSEKIPDLAIMSISTARRDLKELNELGFIVRRELNTKGNKPGEVMYTLSLKGCKAIGKGDEFKSYQKRLKRIQQLRHFQKVREFEQKFKRNAQEMGYIVESYNEFNGSPGRLLIKIPHKGKFTQISSDGEFTVYNQSRPLLYCRIEMDMGTEDFQTVAEKLHRYNLYFENNTLIQKHTSVYPPRLLFVTTDENHIKKICKTINSKRQKGDFLFLSHADIDNKDIDIFQDAVIFNRKGHQFSLAEIIKNRESVLTFHDAMFAAVKKTPYHLTLNTCYNCTHDLFPIDVWLGKKTVSFQPSASLKLWKEHSSQERVVALYALVYVVNNGASIKNIAEKMRLYDIVLSKPGYCGKLTKLPKELYGIIVVAHNEILRRDVYQVCLSYNIKTPVRIILLSDCDENMFYNPILLRNLGDFLSFVR